MSLDKELQTRGINLNNFPGNKARLIRAALLFMSGNTGDGNTFTGGDVDNWNQVFEEVINLARYYTKTQLQTNGQAQVDYGNITNFPAPLTSVVPAVLLHDTFTSGAVMAVHDQNIDTATAGLATIYGYSLVADNYVLLLAQNDQTENAIWEVKDGVPWVKVTSLDYTDRIIQVYIDGATESDLSRIYHCQGNVNHITSFTEITRGLASEEQLEFEYPAEGLIKVWKVTEQPLQILQAISDHNWAGADLEIENGGTGASSAEAARDNLGLEIGVDIADYNDQRILNGQTAFGWGNHAGLYALIAHNHDADYADINHHHDASYAALVHDHNGVYAPLAHNHNADYADINHHHDADYAALGHNHAGVYEPAFSKNTAFNKDFGASAGQVAEGNHHHDAAYAAVGHNHDTEYYTKTELNTSGGAGQVHWDRITNAPTAVSVLSDTAAYGWTKESGSWLRKSFAVTTTGTYKIEGVFSVDSNYLDHALVYLGTSNVVGTGNLVDPRAINVPDNFENNGPNDWALDFKFINVALTTGTTYWLHVTLPSSDSDHFFENKTGDGFEVIRRS